MNLYSKLSLFIMGVGVSAFAKVGDILPPIAIQFGQAAAEKGVEGETNALKILALLTVLGLAPSILIMMTSFIRIVIVLSFLRQAIGTQMLPPNQLIVGLSLFLTAFVMAPVWKKIHTEALGPYLEEKITQKQALQYSELAVRKFMFNQTRDKDMGLFVSLSGEAMPQKRSEVPTYLLIPAFMISELKTAFQIGFMIYIPFLVLDMVVAAVLMAMGMMMLPPVIISLPFKLILFVLVDGWQLIVGSLVKSFG